MHLSGKLPVLLSIKRIFEAVACRFFVLAISLTCGSLVIMFLNLDLVVSLLCQYKSTDIKTTACRDFS